MGGGIKGLKGTKPFHSPCTASLLHALLSPQPPRTQPHPQPRALRHRRPRPAGERALQVLPREEGREAATELLP